MAERYDVFDLYDLEDLEIIERRFPYLPDERNTDLDDLDHVDFKQGYRFEKETVEEVISVLQRKLESQTSRNKAITPAEKVLTALRFFASGSQQINVGDLIRMSQPSANRCINEVSRCLAELGVEYIYLPQTEHERVLISQKFSRRYGFPSVYGALDCTLIKIVNPGGDAAETFRCRKGFFALNVQTLSDSDLFIRNLVARWPGSTHDSTVFDHSYLRAHLESEVPKRYHVLGESGYPLRPYLLTPFMDPLTAAQKRF